MSSQMVEDMKISRRQMLITSATVAVAGCAQAESIVSGPKYEEEDDLSLTLDVFPDSWKDGGNDNDEFESEFENEDGTIIVMSDTEIHDSVDDAKSRMQTRLDRHIDVKETSIADESFLVEKEDHARAPMRHSNATGIVVAVRVSGLEPAPDTGRASKYREEMFGLWQERHN